MLKKIGAVAIKSFALLLLLGTAVESGGGARPCHNTILPLPYAKMAPIDQYLMTDQSAEIA